eukprot:scpid104155/ scgid22152/ 
MLSRGTSSLRRISFLVLVVGIEIHLVLGEVIGRATGRQQERNNNLETLEFGDSVRGPAENRIMDDGVVLERTADGISLAAERNARRRGSPHRDRLSVRSLSENNAQHTHKYRLTSRFAMAQ